MRNSRDAEFRHSKCVGSSAKPVISPILIIVIGGLVLLVGFIGLTVYRHLEFTNDPYLLCLSEDAPKFHIYTTDGKMHYCHYYTYDGEQVYCEDRCSEDGYFSNDEIDWERR